MVDGARETQGKVVKKEKDAILENAGRCFIFNVEMLSEVGQSVRWLYFNLEPGLYQQR